jgi:PAS domain S-box-containing protein
VNRESAGDRATAGIDADGYRAIFEATGDGVIIADMDGNLVDVNPALCRMHGYSREEMLRLYPTEFIHPDYHGIFAEYMASLHEGRPYRTTALDLRKDGTAFPVEVNGTVFSYRGRRCVLGIVRDITERVRAQELLEQRVEERTRELDGLLEVSRTVGSTLELEPLLDLILDALKAVVDYGTAGILVVEGDSVQVLGFRGPVPHTHLRTPVPTLSWPEWGRLKRGETVVADGPGGSREQFLLRSYVVVPMAVRERVIGGLSVSHAEPGYFTEHHASLLRSFASQAAIAIENARLYEQAQELAILEERQRLSRELHDSVSQALYGIGLAAETTRALLQHDPERAAKANEMVRSLAASGMAEMRALLFELRPESLQLEGLVAALEKQCQAVEARHQIPVTRTFGDEPNVSLSAKEALYRIAQEALHNAVKHAAPTRFEVQLQSAANDVSLEIRDDGRGFDPGELFPGHLGLHTMRERAARLGGTLEIESAPGQGTTVRARIPITAGR